jgi:hypothetical protein
MVVVDSAGDWSHGLRDLSAAGSDGLATATEAEVMFKKQSHRFDHIATPIHKEPKITKALLRHH